MIGSLLDLPVSDDRFEIRLSGSGGQGLVLGALLLAEAIGKDPAKSVVQTKSYGPEARGGASKSDVVVSGGEIYYPKALKLDLLLAMTQEALDKYLPDMKKDGALVVDSSLVTKIPINDYYGLPFTQLAKDQLGNVMVANVISLGAISAITGIVTIDLLLEAVLARAPRGTEEINRQAVEIGFREGLAQKEEKEKNRRAV